MSKVNSKNKSPNKKSPPVCLNKHQDNKIQELTDAEKIKLKNMNGVVNGVVNERKSASKKQKGHVKKEQLNGNCSENLDSVMKEHFIPENDQISNEDEKKNHFRGDLEHLSNSKSHLNSNNITCSTSKTVDNQKDFKLCSKKTKHKLKEKEVLEDKDCVKKDITNLSSRNNVDSKHDTTTECDLTIKHDANTKKGDKITVEEDLTTTKKNSLITSDNIGSEKEKVTTSKNVGEIVHRKEEKSNRDDEKNECTDKNNDKTSLEEINKSKNNNEICDTSANLENLKIDDKNANSIENVKQPKLNIKYVQYESELQMPMIMKIIQKDLSEPYSIYTYRYFIHNWPNLCFLAMYENQCVGAIVCKLDIHRKVIKRGYIAMLAVDKNFRKQGIGSTLVRRAIQEMIVGDADEVVLETEITNKPALKLYEALGFVRDKRLFRYYLNGVDALRLKLWLR